MQKYNWYLYIDLISYNFAKHLFTLIALFCGFFRFFFIWFCHLKIEIIFIPFFPIWMPFICYSGTISLASTYSSMVKKAWQEWESLPSLWSYKKIFFISTLNMMTDAFILVNVAWVENIFLFIALECFYNPKVLNRVMFCVYWNDCVFLFFFILLREYIILTHFQMLKQSCIPG